MLGASRRLGADDSQRFEPQIRITGVFKGADVLQSLIDTKRYTLLPPVDVYLGLQLKIITEAWVEEMRAQQTEGEWIRQFLCKNISSQNCAPPPATTFFDTDDAGFPMSFASAAPMLSFRLSSGMNPRFSLCPNNGRPNASPFFNL